jgi:hypothetical protein
MFSSKISFSLSKIGNSLFSESFSVSDVLYALFKGGGVLDNSLSGIINSGLRDTHEGGVSSKLVFFFFKGKGNTGNHFGSYFTKSSAKFGKHFRVSEIG